MDLNQEMEEYDSSIRFRLLIACQICCAVAGFVRKSRVGQYKIEGVSKIDKIEGVRLGFLVLISPISHFLYIRFYVIDSLVYSGSIGLPSLNCH